MTRSRIRDERGQLIVIFALALTALVAMVGLVLDGGSTYAQRRSEQNAVDLAALAAANDLIVNQGSADWVGTARSVAKQNGYEDGVGSVTVDVSCKNCPGEPVDVGVPGVQVTVRITAKHRNAFAGVLGMPTWDVSATATSKTGWPDTATAPGPFIVSKKAFNASGKATSCRDVNHQCTLDHPVEDTPTAATEFTWTNFGYNTPCHDTGNVDDQDLQAYMDSSATFEVTLAFGCYIAQHNNGTMNNVVSRLQGLTPITFPIPIVDESGNYVGWASFVLTSASPNGRNGTLTGYFETGNFQNQRLDVRSPGFGTSTFGGTYTLKLVN